ncbi:MAG: DUF2924 domain-containing protein [Mesorhizobium sp.]|nr:MAG: DUF2924 domain-containing protein [Mesorhizobium sp.]
MLIDCCLQKPLPFGAVLETEPVRRLPRPGEVAVRRRRGEDRPIAGTQLLREWQGVEQTVTVLADGYEWQGRPYQSLSSVARAITGTRWNSWLFFGLKNHCSKARGRS